MPPVAASPDKPINRRRRKHQKTDTSQNHSNSLADEVSPRQTKSDHDSPANGMETSLTPPSMDTRPVADYSVPGQVSWSTGGVEKPKNTPKKNRNSLPNGSPQLPKINGTPRSNQRSITLTPGKKITTPSRLYAGPTFHASPAASSLPMPKFYSKSVPDVNKAPSMQTAMKEASELSSDQSEDSPTPGFAKSVGEPQAREESPLDIFFRADREQKERQRLEKQGVTEGHNPPGKAPALNRPRFHSRHSTSGSQGGLFSMELENREPAKVSHEKALSDPTTNNSVVNKPEASQCVEAVETPQQAEQRRAKTIALKKLLMSPVPMTATPASRQGTASESDDAGIRSTSVKPKHESTPHIQKQFAVQIARQESPCPRPCSSLRKEVSAFNLPGKEPVPELPATPTPSRTRYAQISSPPPAQQHLGTVAQDSPTRSDAAPGTAINPFKTMEDDLRRILKITDLSNGSSEGVPS